MRAVLREYVVSLTIRGREPRHNTLAKQCLDTVSCDLSAIWTENDCTLFAIAGSNPEDHDLCRLFREGANPDTFVNFVHWQVCKISAVTLIHLSIGDKGRVFRMKKCRLCRSPPSCVSGVTF
jgi:hypothetical protein